jgi:hypothetical protein
MKASFPDLDRIEIREARPESYEHRLEVYLIRNGKPERLEKSNLEYNLRNGGTRLHFSVDAENFREARASGGTSEQVKDAGTRFLIDPTARNNTEGLLRDVVRGPKKGRSAQVFRQRMIDAFWKQTPAGRIDQSLGFTQLTQITLRLNHKIDVPPGQPPPKFLYDSGLIDVEVNRGPPLDPSQVTVEIEDDRGEKINVMRLMPDGTIVRAKRTLPIAKDSD